MDLGDLFDNLVYGNMHMSDFQKTETISAVNDPISSTLSEETRSLLAWDEDSLDAIPKETPARIFHGSKSAASLKSPQFPPRIREPEQTLESPASRHFGMNRSMIMALIAVGVVVVLALGSLMFEYISQPSSRTSMGFNGRERDQRNVLPQSTVIAESTHSYWMNVHQIVRNMPKLQSSGNPTADQIAIFIVFGTLVTKIENLPRENVDPVALRAVDNLKASFSSIFEIAVYATELQGRYGRNIPPEEAMKTVFAFVGVIAQLGITLKECEQAASTLSAKYHLDFPQLIQ